MYYLSVVFTSLHFNLKHYICFTRTHTHTHTQTHTRTRSNVWGLLQHHLLQQTHWHLHGNRYQEPICAHSVIESFFQLLHSFSLPLFLHFCVGKSEVLRHVSVPAVCLPSERGRRTQRTFAFGWHGNCFIVELWPVMASSHCGCELNPRYLYTRR